MFQKIINSCVKLVQRYLPEPFIFAIILTVVAIIVAIPICDQSLMEVVGQVLSTYDGDLRDLFWWPQERPVPMRVARGPLGIPLP